MWKAVGCAGGLLLVASIAAAQETSVEAEYEYIGQTDPVTAAPMQEIGCALSASGSSSDVSATLTLTWESEEEWGSTSWSDTQWGYISHVLSHSAPVTADDMRVQCDVEVYFSGGFNTVIQRSSVAYAPGQPPYVTVASDTGNQWTHRWERHVWYQIWNPNSTAWTKGGTIWETWLESHNPCNLVMFQASGAVNSNGQFVDSYYYDSQAIGNPACTYEGE